MNSLILSASVVLFPCLVGTLGFPSLPQKTSSHAKPVRQFGLRTRLEIETQGKPLGLSFGDLDQDGLSELFVATKSPGSVQVLGEFQAGIGPTRTPLSLPIGDYPVGPIFCDSELVVASRSNNTLYFFDGDSLLTKRARLEVSLPNPPRVLVAVDVDRDGKQEICALTRENQILIVNPRGEIQETFSGHDQATCAWALDDGRLVIGFQVGREVCLYARDENEKRGWRIDWEVTFQGVPRALHELDVDGNGDLELAISGGDREHWVLGLDGTRGRQDWIETEVVRPKRFEWGAIPYALDSAQDSSNLYSMAYFEPAWARFGGKGMKRLEGGYAGQAPVAISACDLNADGRTDLAIANSEARRVSLLFGNQKDQLDTAPSIRTGRAPTFLATCDVDRDGKFEAITLNTLENSYSVLAWNGEALELVQSETSGSETYGIACGDLDHDGRPDLVVLRRDSSGGSVNLRFGGPSGQFETRPGTRNLQLGKSATDALVIPGNARNKPRLYVVDPVGDSLFALGWSDVLAIEQELGLASAPRAIAALDSHGKRLAVALSGPGPRVGIAIVGTNAKLVELDYIPLTASPHDVCSGDFDGDGRRDIGVLALDRGRDGGALFLSFLARDKGFIPGPQQRTGLRAHSIACGDLDGDGRDDVLVSAQNSHHVNLWMSRRGSETESVRFERFADLGLETGPLGLALADADGDGQLDLFVANAFADCVSLVRNQTR